MYAGKDTDMIDSLIKQWSGENVIIRHDKPVDSVFRS